MLLVDVREPNETSVESYPGCSDRTAILLRSYRHSRSEGQAGGVRLPFRRRSITASVAAQDQGFPYKSHLAGGIIAWKAAGLPTALAEFRISMRKFCILVLLAVGIVAAPARVPTTCGTCLRSRP